MIKRIFSGIQPTGVAHIGNYLGAIRHWVALQETAQRKTDVMFCVVDLHSCTTCHDPKIMHDNIFKMVASLLACGIDPQKSLLFQQSQVPYHSELSWFLGCLASTGQLKRMHQWKSKKSKEKDENNLGLFSYPVLMAADILLYRATHVPVGDDQIQHLELTRDLTEILNKRYNLDFPLPQAMLTSASRVMSLRQPTDKMSKSSTNENSRIDIHDHPDVIAMKIKKAVTDSAAYLTDDLSDRHGVRNLLEIYNGCDDSITMETLLDRYRDVQYFTKNLKTDLTDVVVNRLEPIRNEYIRLLDAKEYLSDVLREGSTKARVIASENMKKVYQNIGLR